MDSVILYFLHFALSPLFLTVLVTIKHPVFIFPQLNLLTRNDRWSWNHHLFVQLLSARLIERWIIQQVGDHWCSIDCFSEGCSVKCIWGLKRNDVTTIVQNFTWSVKLYVGLMALGLAIFIITEQFIFIWAVLMMHLHFTCIEVSSHSVFW